MNVLRDGRDTPLKVTHRHAFRKIARDRAGRHAHPTEQQIGVALAPLSPEARNQLNLAENTKGAVIAGVQPNSPAEMAGLREGDVLVGIGAKTVNSPDDAVSAIRSARREGKTVALRVLRDGQSHYVAIPGKASANG